MVVYTETPILWPPHAKSWLIGKDPDAGKDWGQEEKGTTEDEMAGWHHRLNGDEFEWAAGVGDHTLHNWGLRSWMNSATKFCLIRHVHLISRQPDYHFFKHLDNFLQEKRFHNQQDAENGFQEFVESRSTDFYATRIDLLLIGKNVLIVMVPILINKGVFEPSYNDSKFTARNCNFVCTNLIVTRVWGVGA